MLESFWAKQLWQVPHPQALFLFGVVIQRISPVGVIPLQFLNRALVPLVPSGKALVIATEALATIAQNTVRCPPPTRYSLVALPVFFLLAGSRGVSETLSGSQDRFTAVCKRRESQCRIFK